MTDQYKSTDDHAFTSKATVLHCTKVLSEEGMDNGVLPFSNILNDKSNNYTNFVVSHNSEKAFQANDNLEDLMNGQENDTTVAQGLNKFDFYAVNVREVCCTEVCNKTRQEQKSFSISAMQDLGEDFGINLREKSSRSEGVLRYRSYNRQSSIINLKDDKRRLLKETLEHVGSANEAPPEIGLEYSKKPLEPDKEISIELKRQNAEALVIPEIKEDERKFDEQPETLIEDGFINLAISRTKEDFKKQQTIINTRIHGNEAKVQDEGDFFVSLRTTKIRRPTKVKEIGRGAFGKCFLYKYHSNNDRTEYLAVKEMENKNDNSEDERRKEYLMLKKLDHPNIVRCFWDAIHPITKKYKIAMEYMCGGSVSNLLQWQKDGFDEELIKHYIVQLLMGLEYLHSKSILHRDIKGENLLLCEDFNILKICDFGCAADVDCIDEGFADTKLVGTVPFMAPEVVSRQHYSAASDMWSVGCCIFQMATGQLPWNANRNEESAVLYRIGMAESPPQVPECLSTALQELTRKCLTIDKKERITASDFREELDKAIVQEM